MPIVYLIIGSKNGSIHLMEDVFWLFLYSKEDFIVAVAKRAVMKNNFDGGKSRTLYCESYKH